jgi:hypothetical protein
MTNPNDSIHNSEQGTNDGLTKREYFAAMAMQGLCGNSTYAGNVEGHVELAVRLADGLITELNKQDDETK